MTRNQEICDLYLAGFSQNDIAKHFKINRHKVRKALKRKGVPSRNIKSAMGMWAQKQFHGKALEEQANENVLDKRL